MEISQRNPQKNNSKHILYVFLSASAMTSTVSWEFSSYELGKTVKNCHCIPASSSFFGCL